MCMHAEDRPRTETSKQLSADGYDVQLQANVISHFLLTRLLMPALQIAAGSRGTARIINCTSGGRDALCADVPAEAFARTTGKAAAVGATEGGGRANAYGIVPGASAAERKRRAARPPGAYQNCRERYLQSRKANLVLAMALRVRPPPLLFPRPALTRPASLRCLCVNTPVCVRLHAMTYGGRTRLPAPCPLTEPPL